MLPDEVLDAADRQPGGPIRPVDSFNRSDVGNGELLAYRHGPVLRHVGAWNRWLHWTGRRWEEDRTGELDRLAKETLRWLAANANELADDKARRTLLKFALDSEREPRVRAMIAMARSEPGISLLPEQIDANPWLLNVGNGTLDLNTGDLSAHQPEDLLTLLTAVDYDPHATCPVWDAFLEVVLAGDQELATFLQRLVGYSLTGSTREQVLAILHGTGANGKTTFLQTIMELLGDYAQQAAPETFLERREGIPNDVARLRGARLVAAAETGEGRSLNESFVKRITGGDTITARFMRAEWFSFEPTFTPWLITNHAPRVRGTDHAIWRRIRLVPFTVTIPDHERDPDLRDKLRGELAGILAWAVQGCLDWQKHGLGQPAAVTHATDAYREEMDTLGVFIEDTCTTGDTLWAQAGDLYRAYTSWADAAGEQRISQQRFGRRLTERGYDNARTNNGRRWLGIALNNDPNAYQPMTLSDAISQPSDANRSMTHDA